MLDKNGHFFHLPAMLGLTTGETMRGDIILPRMQSLFEALNKPDAFITLLDQTGRTMVIAKSSIATATEFKLPKNDQLERGQASFDPAQTLGVDSASTAQEIREAYLAKVKQYHPDNFASVKLPVEVVEYLQAMFRHIQVAYEDLAPKQQSEPVRHRVEPA